MRRKIADAVGFTLAFVLILAAACAPSRKTGGDVTGTVEFAGKPVNYGAITIVGEDRHAAISEIKNGAYLLKQPPFGPCKIMILTAPPPPPDGVDFAKYKPPPDYIDVPMRYGRVETSGLTLAVTEQPQTHNIKLTK